MGEWFRRFHYLINRRSFDRELQNEMEFHREMAARTEGAPFGNTLQFREQARDAWGWTWIDRLGQDLGYGVRILARSPGFTLMAILVLAIGVGVNVAAFSVFDMVALRALPVRDADRIVRLERRSPDNYTSEMSYPSFLFYRDHAKTLSSTVAVLGVPPMQIDDDVQGASTCFVTPNYFSELGTQAAFGRLIHPAADGKSDAPPAMVISYGFWQRRFGGDASVIGRTVRLNKAPVTIVGVTPYALATLGGQHPDIWLSLAQQPYFVAGSQILKDFDNPSIRMWGKLAPGVTLQSAELELKSLTNQLRHQHPSAVWEREFIQVSPGGHLQVMQPAMYQVAAMVGVLTFLILAVACGNLGALLLAKAVQREREISIRLAIGASATRVFRQLCTESILLASLGSLAGLALGSAIMRIALPLLDAPKWLSATPNLHIVLFTIAASFLSAVLFGLTPSLQIARQAQRKTRARQILVTAQLAASCVLLIVAALLVRAAQHALYTDPGFGYERLTSIDPQLRQHGYGAAQAKAYLDQMQTRLRAVPGVRSVALVMLPPLGHAVSYSTTIINSHEVRIFPNWVTPGFFTTMQTPLLLGRTFYPNEKNVVVVSKSFAAAQWPHQNPLGQLIGDGPVKDAVAGVVADAHTNALNDDDALEEYWPAGDDQLPGMVLMVRTEGVAENLPDSAKAISESLDPKLFTEIRSIRSLYARSLSEVEQIAGAVTLIGLVALGLVGVGVVGLVSFTVWQKTKDIAIRMALGATPAQIVQSILRQFSWPAAIGLLTGTLAAAASSSILRRTLFGVSNLDPFAYAGAVGFLVAVLAFSALVPARRALRINLSKALRYQ